MLIRWFFGKEEMEEMASITQEAELVTRVKLLKGSTVPT